MTAVAQPPQLGGIYLGYSDAEHTVRHLSLVPFVDGLTALCGACLVSTTPTQPELRTHAVSCAYCRALMF